MLRNCIIIILNLFVLSSVAQSRADSSIRQRKDSTVNAQLQSTDSTLVNDSIPVKDSVSPRVKVLTTPFTTVDGYAAGSFALQQMLDHHFWDFRSKPKADIYQRRVVMNKDWMFYVICGLLLLLGILKLAFPRFFGDLFRLFFNTTLKQMQIRERLLQSDLPSLLLNIFFVLSGGLYVFFVMNYYGVTEFSNHWYALGLATLVLLGIYLVKYIGLKFSGWLFGMSESTDLYIFIVSLVNKLLGIFLLPFIILMAYSDATVAGSVVMLSFLIIGALFLVRFVRAWSSLRGQLKISMFHFFLYLLGFEIIPLLLIYKTLMLYIERST